MASEMKEALKPIKGPVVLIGYSLGGALAYQIALELHKDGRSVVVVPIDTRIRALFTPRGMLYRRFRKLLYRRPKRLLQKLRRVDVSAENSKRDGDWLSNDPALAAFVEESRVAIRRYAPPVSDIPVVLVRTKMSQGVHKWIEASDWPSKSHGWKRISSVHKVVEAPGDHVTIIHKENVPALAQSLDIALSAAFAVVGSRR
jgi:thioesterase domain-containing protein